MARWWVGVLFQGPIGQVQLQGGGHVYDYHEIVMVLSDGQVV